MAAAHLNGDDEGGRQLHQRRHREHHAGGEDGARLRARQAAARSREPEIVLPVTGHAAFQKAAHYLGVKPVLVPVDPATFKADVDAVRRAITPNTILLVGSAVSYAHGVVDPIRELGQLALEHDLLFHVDACMGGFLLPYFRRLGAPVPDFDFSVPGVTSISMDFHKYAFAAKGASMVLYRNKELRRYQIYTCAQWTGYTVINPTVQSTKSAGPLAAAWAVLQLHRRRRLPGDRPPGARRPRARIADAIDADGRPASAGPAGDEPGRLHVRHRERLPHHRRDEGARLVHPAAARIPAARRRTSTCRSTPPASSGSMRCSPTCGTASRRRRR